jgi:hypothetical protein
MKFTPKSGTVKIKIALDMKPSMMGKSVRGPALSAATNGPGHPRKSITTSPLMKIANGGTGTGTGTGTNTPTKYDPLLQELEEGDENESWWWQAMKEKFSFFSSADNNHKDKMMKKEEHLNAHQGPPHVDGAKVIGTLKISIIDSGPGIDLVRISLFSFVLSIVYSFILFLRMIKRNYSKNMFKSLLGNYRKVKEVD